MSKVRQQVEQRQKREDSDGPEQFDADLKKRFLFRTSGFHD
jgi:hypothetical protein